MVAQTIPKRGRGRPRSQNSEQATGTVQALEKGVILLQALTRNSFLTLTDISEQVGMSTSTAHRLLSTLEKYQFTEFDDISKEWSIGIEAFRVGSAYLTRTNLIESSRNILRGLMEQTGETANLGIADGADVVFIHQVETNHPIRAFFPPGSRGQLHASGIGKALLANMPRRDVEKLLKQNVYQQFTDNTKVLPVDLFADLDLSRERGWAFDDEERHLGMRCIAACIFNAYGEAIAGVSVSGPTIRFPDHMIALIGPQVEKAAQEITSLIGGKHRSVSE